MMIHDGAFSLTSPSYVDQDIKNQKLQEKKKDNLAKAARPSALAAQVKPTCNLRSLFL